MPRRSEPALQGTLRQLGQLRPANTTPQTLYTPADGIIAKNVVVIVCNVSAGNANYSIYHDDNGTTYDQTTALHYGVQLTSGTAATPVSIDIPIHMDDDTGSIGVQTSVADALTFTAYGEEIQVRAR